MTRKFTTYKRYKPRKFIQIKTREWRKYPDPIFEGKYYNREVGAPPPFSDTQIDKWRRQGWRYERQPKIGILERSRNSHNSPLCIGLVCDLLLRTDPAAMFPARDFADALSEEFPHILWDQYTVGRILRNISDTSGLTSRINQQMPPVSTSKMGPTTLYMVNASRQNWWWLASVRDAFMDRAQWEYNNPMEPRDRADDTAWAPIDQIPRWGERGAYR